jgi:hypothetical protein
VRRKNIKSRQKNIEVKRENNKQTEETRFSFKEAEEEI